MTREKILIYLMSKLFAFAGALRDNVSEFIFDNSSDGVLQLN
jgi:hypothetical protein